ncbi:MAG TPA: ABC transporter permease [Kiloniellales bacterium]|nr:ABC transporter permease [Kiloniellales bacterium]
MVSRIEVQAGRTQEGAAPARPWRLASRSFGRLNGRGLWTLYLKEVKRFVNVATQTLLAPVMTTLLFLAVFTLALGRGNTLVDGVSYGLFLVPGLTVMAMMQNAFANTSSSIVIAKVQGNIVDVLMPPLSGFELALGFAAGGVTRGLLVGLAVWTALSLFTSFAVHDLPAMLFFATNACLMLSLLGLIGGIWSEKFDHIAAVTNFVVTPLSFLSGTFYTVDRLPDGWQFLAHLNPFFYMIDGVRYGALGHADSPLWVGALVLLAINAALFLLAWRILHTGWRLKA